MTYQTMQRRLKKLGVHTRKDSGLLMDCDSGRISGMMICASRRKGRWLSGASFWVHLSESSAFVGLFTCRLFKLSDVERIVDLAHDIIDFQRRTGDLIPKILADEIVGRYALVEVHSNDWFNRGSCHR